METNKNIRNKLENMEHKQAIPNIKESQDNWIF
jgi:hypothetical protein